MTFVLRKDKQESPTHIPVSEHSDQSIQSDSRVPSSLDSRDVEFEKSPPRGSRGVNDISHDLTQTLDPNEATQSDIAPSSQNIRRLPCGTRISDEPAHKGLGRLKVENGTSLDAVVRLARSDDNQAAIWFYVCSNATTTIDKIEPGTYDLTYTMGLDWDDDANEFVQQASYNIFERQVTYFERTDTGNSTVYKSVSVTLQPVPSGNVRTRTISRKDFLKGLQAKLSFHHY